MGDGSEERLNVGCASCGTGRALAATNRCGNGLEKIYPATGVRFGYMRYLGEFTHQADMRFTCGAKVVIQTQRGIEVGEQVSYTCTGCDKSVAREQIKAWVASSGEDTYMFNAGRILREATAADLAEYTRIQNTCRIKRDLAQRIAAEHKLPLRVAECECLFGGERIIFYFTADERIDFRGMVKDLAREYRTRIEMRQIGTRDEARLLADYETCGREVCCKALLKTLKPISMRMAKLQKATLDPSQVSGRCGRLKCCLRFEHTGYEELNRRLPRLGVRIRTSNDEGVVVNRQILTQLVQIRRDNDSLVAVVVEDITAVDVPAPPPQAESTESTRPEQQVERQPTGREPRRGRRSGRGRPTQPVPRRTEKTEPQTRGSGSPEPPADKQAGGEQPTRRRRRRRRRRRGDGGNRTS